MSLWFNISNSEVAVIFFITCLRVIDSTTRIINRNLVNFCATVIKKQICISLGTLQHNSYSHLIEYSTVNAGNIGVALRSKNQMNSESTTLAHNTLHNSCRLLCKFIICIGEQLVELVHNNQDTRHLFSQRTILLDFIDMAFLKEICTDFLLTFQCKQDVISELTLTFDSHNLERRKFKISVNFELNTTFEVN